VSVGVEVTVFVSVGEDVSLRVELPVPTLVGVWVPLEPPEELAVEVPVSVLVRLLELPAFELPLIALELLLDPLLASGPPPLVGTGPPSSAKLPQSPMPSRLPHPPSQQPPRTHAVPRDAALNFQRVRELTAHLIRTNLSSSSPLRPGRPSG
jgi:hypothetical protein